MVKVSGLARITSGPHFYSDAGKGYGADLIVEFKKNQTLQLVSTSWLMTECLYPLQTGFTVHFEGTLEADEPGMYIIRLTAIRRSNNR
jgi:hypothetical protein